MTPYVSIKEKIIFRQIRKVVSIVILAAFISTSIKSPAYAQMASNDQLPWMPKPGVMVRLSPEFTPAHLQGIIIHPENPLRFDFIIYKGDENLPVQKKQVAYKKLIKYFLASLAVPDEHQWVNLSPYEKHRIIKDDFGKTEMGRDLLSQDYMLKQITASLIYPEDGLGKKFWNTVYERAYKEYGSTDIPVNTFNKVWIVPGDALVYEDGNTAYVLKNHLKVMLEEDYMSLANHTAIIAPQPKKATEVNKIGSQIVRQIVLPALEKEVNEGKNFAMLRQVYSGMILAAWYKRALKESLLGRVYANKAKVKGIDQNPKTNEEIYERYLKAYKKGVFNFIKEDVDKYTNETVPRKYFSGGTQGEAWANNGRGVLVTKDKTLGNQAMSADAAMGKIEIAESYEEELSVARAVAGIASAAMTSAEAQRQVEGFIQGPNGYRLEGQVGPDRLEQAIPIAMALLQELHGKPLDYNIHDTAFTKGDITRDPEVNLMVLEDKVGRVEISTFMQIVFLRMLRIINSPSNAGTTKMEPVSWLTFQGSDANGKIVSELLPDFSGIPAFNRNQYLRHQIQAAYIELRREIIGKPDAYQIYGTDKTVGTLSNQDFMDIVKKRVLEPTVRPGDLVLKDMTSNPARSIGLLGGHAYLFQMIELWKQNNPGKSFAFLAARVKRFAGNVYSNNPDKDEDLKDKLAAAIAYGYVARNGQSSGWERPDPEHTPEEMDKMIDYISHYDANEFQRIQHLLETGEALKQSLFDALRDSNAVEKIYGVYQDLKKLGLPESEMWGKFVAASPSNDREVAGQGAVRVVDALWRDYKPKEPKVTDYAMAAPDAAMGVFDFPIFEAFELAAQLGDVNQRMEEYGEHPIIYRTSMINLRGLYNKDKVLFEKFLERVAAYSRGEVPRILFADDPVVENQLKVFGVISDLGEVPYAIKAMVEAVIAYTGGGLAAFPKASSFDAAMITDFTKVKILPLQGYIGRSATTYTARPLTEAEQVTALSLFAKIVRMPAVSILMGEELIRAVDEHLVSINEENEYVQAAVHLEIVDAVRSGFLKGRSPSQPIVAEDQWTVDVLRQKFFGNNANLIDYVHASKGREQFYTPTPAVGEGDGSQKTTGSLFGFLFGSVFDAAMNTPRPSQAQQAFWGIKLISDARLAQVKEKYAKLKVKEAELISFRELIAPGINRIYQHLSRINGGLHRAGMDGISIYTGGDIHLTDSRNLSPDQKVKEIADILSRDSDLFGAGALANLNRGGLKLVFVTADALSEGIGELMKFQGFPLPGTFLGFYDPNYLQSAERSLYEEELPKNHFFTALDRFGASDYHATGENTIVEMLKRFGVDVSGLDAVATTDKEARRKMIFNLLKPMIENSDAMPVNAKEYFRWTVASYLFQAGTKMLPLNPVQLTANEFILEIDKKLGLITPKGDARTGSELAAKLRPYLFPTGEQFFAAAELLGQRDFFILTELHLRGGPAVAVGIEEFNRKMAAQDISHMTGPDLIKFLYSTGAIQYVPGSEVRDPAMNVALRDGKTVVPFDFVQETVRFLGTIKDLSVFHHLMILPVAGGQVSITSPRWAELVSQGFPEEMTKLSVQYKHLNHPPLGTAGLVGAIIQNSIRDGVLVNPLLPGQGTSFNAKFANPLILLGGLDLSGVMVVTHSLSALKIAFHADPASISERRNPFGGIDFNAANLNLQIKRNGKGVPLPISQQDLENIKIDGLVPIIIDIKPVTGFPAFSGLQASGVH